MPSPRACGKSPNRSPACHQHRGAEKPKRREQPGRLATTLHWTCHFAHGEYLTWSLPRHHQEESGIAGDFLNKEAISKSLEHGFQNAFVLRRVLVEQTSSRTFA